MAIIDKLQKISDTIWELPASYKEGMRVPARIIATEKLVREMDEAVYQQMWGPSEFHATGNLKEFDRVSRLSEIHEPVLFIVGRFDEARVQTVTDFQTLIPGSKLEVVEGAGHMAMVDEPERYTQALRDFLQQVDAK